MRIGLDEGATVVPGSQGDYHSTWIEETTPRRLTKKLLARILPVYVLDQIGFELHMLLVRTKYRGIRRQYGGRRNLLVNIGAGASGVEGWVNLDGFPGRGVDCVVDARRQLPFDDESVRGIFAEHFFEHIDYTEEAPGFLQECQRVLIPGGVIRLVVPDAEKYLIGYSSGKWEALAAVRPLDNGRDAHYGWSYNTRMELINFVFRQGQQHKFAYDFETLDFLLRKNGFCEISRCAFGRSRMQELCIDAKHREPESLYVEAAKGVRLVH
jgi:predicted SAM-dependent methyltransferase